MTGDRGPTWPDDFAHLVQPVDRDRAPLRWSDIKGVEPSMPPPSPVREPAYEAVRSIIRGLDDRTLVEAVRRNAVIWRSVEAALDAMGVPSGHASEGPA